MSLLAYVKRYAGGFADSPATTSAIDAAFLNAVETALLGLLGASPTDGQVQVYDDALGRFKTTLITNAHIDAAAAIAKSKLASLQIADADVAAGAAIAASKLAGNIPASKLSSYPADANKLLAGDGTWADRALARVRAWKTTNTTIPANTTTTLTWDSEDYNVGGIHSIGTNPTRFTAPATGRYLFALAIDLQTGSAAGLRTLQLQKNGATVVSAIRINCPAGSAQGFMLTDIIPLAAADYIEVQVVPTATVGDTVTGNARNSYVAVQRVD